MMGRKVSSGASGGTGMPANSAYLACTISDGSSEPGVAYIILDSDVLSVLRSDRKVGEAFAGGVDSYGVDENIFQW